MAPGRRLCDFENAIPLTRGRLYKAWTGESQGAFGAGQGYSVPRGHLAQSSTRWFSSRAGTLALRNPRCAEHRHPPPQSQSCAGTARFSGPPAAHEIHVPRDMRLRAAAPRSPS